MNPLIIIYSKKAVHSIRMTCDTGDMPAKLASLPYNLDLPF